MCKTYNPVGSLTKVKQHLSQNGITDFHSLREVTDFQQTFPTAVAESFSRSKQVITAEADQLQHENQRLQDDIQNIINGIEADTSAKIERWTARLLKLDQKASGSWWSAMWAFGETSLLKTNISWTKYRLPATIARSTRFWKKIQAENDIRHRYLTAHFQEAVEAHNQQALANLHWKLKVIDELKNTIAGAIGEHQVAKMLAQLPDDYTLINDFCITFPSPIRLPGTNECMKSVQIDHVLIGPSGVFIIETKNWSAASLENKNLWSPLEQMRRNNLALYLFLQKTPGSQSLQHHWGKKKTPIRNVLVMVNQKPMGEFEYVKMVSLSQLNGYITHLAPVMTRREMERVTDAMLQYCARR